MMNRTDFTTTTIKLTTADREKLAEWSRANLTNMAAEITRSIRERAAREVEKNHNPTNAAERNKNGDH